ncbi:hypothetical protein, partial [Cloacibacillus porcorum]
HAASVRPEPGSNSPFDSQPTLSLTVRSGLPVRTFLLLGPHILIFLHTRLRGPELRSGVCFFCFLFILFVMVPAAGRFLRDAGFGRNKSKYIIFSPNRQPF